MERHGNQGQVIKEWQLWNFTVKTTFHPILLWRLESAYRCVLCLEKEKLTVKMNLFSTEASDFISCSIARVETSLEIDIISMFKNSLRFGIYIYICCSFAFQGGGCAIQENT